MSNEDAVVIDTDDGSSLTAHYEVETFTYYCRDPHLQQTQRTQPTPSMVDDGDETIDESAPHNDRYDLHHVESKSIIPIPIPIPIPNESRKTESSLSVRIKSATTTVGGHIVSSTHDATGIMIWPATHLLCQYILSNVSRPTPREPLSSYATTATTSPLFRGRRPMRAILELGCGCGLVGVVAAAASAIATAVTTGEEQNVPNGNTLYDEVDRCPPKFVWISTDKDQVALQLCQFNHTLNGLLTTSNGTDTSTTVDQSRSMVSRVQTLRWDNRCDQEAVRETLRRLRDHQIDERKDSCYFDTIVAADIVYPTTCGNVLSALLATVDALLSEHGTFLLSFCSRDGPHTPRHLLQAATDAGFGISPVDPVDWLDRSNAARLPPLLGACLLVLERRPDAAEWNARLGGTDCPLFPGLWDTLARIQATKDEPNSDNEWDAPFDEDDGVDQIQFRC